MDLVIVACVLAAALVALRTAARAAITLCVAEVIDGEVAVTRGRLPPAVLADVRDVVNRPPVPRATLRVLRARTHARIEVQGRVPAAQLQQLRNVVGNVPLARLLAGALVLTPGAARGQDAPPVAPAITLQVIPAAAGRLWTMRVENVGELPLHLIADARLLALEVTLPGDARTTRCELPQAMRAVTRERALALPPKRAYVETFDPRLYCFDAKATAAWVPNAIVVGRLGYAPSPRRGKAAPRAVAPLKVSGPYVVEPIEGLEPRVSAAKEIVSAPLTLDGASLTVTEEAPPAGPYLVSMSPRIDVVRGSDAVATVTILNVGDAATRVRARPAVIDLEVGAPGGGATRCSWPAGAAPPIRELTVPLPPRGRTTMEFLVAKLCPAGTFDAPGIYVLHAHVDASRLTAEGASGATDVAAAAPTLMRVQVGADGAASSSRPQLAQP